MRFEPTSKPRNYSRIFHLTLIKIIAIIIKINSITNQLKNIENFPLSQLIRGFQNLKWKISKNSGKREKINEIEKILNAF